MEMRALDSLETRGSKKTEAQLVLLCCSDPPEGQQRWTLQLLVDELDRLNVVD